MDYLNKIWARQPVDINALKGGIVVEIGKIDKEILSTNNNFNYFNDENIIHEIPKLKKLIDEISEILKKKVWDILGAKLAWGKLQEIHNIIKESKKRRAIIFEYSDDCADEEAEIARLIEENRNLVTRLSKSGIDLTSSRDTLKNGNVRVSDLETKINQTLRQLDETKKELANQTERNGDLENHASGLEIAADDLLQEVAEAVKTIAKINEEKSRLAENIEEAIKLIDDRDRAHAQVYAKDTDLLLSKLAEAEKIAAGHVTECKNCVELKVEHQKLIKTNAELKVDHQKLEESLEREKTRTGQLRDRIVEKNIQLQRREKQTPPTKQVVKGRQQPTSKHAQQASETKKINDDGMYEMKSRWADREHQKGPDDQKRHDDQEQQKRHEQKERNEQERQKHESVDQYQWRNEQKRQLPIEQQSLEERLNAEEKNLQQNIARKNDAESKHNITSANNFDLKKIHNIQAEQAKAAKELAERGREHNAKLEANRAKNTNKKKQDGESKEKLNQPTATEQQADADKHAASEAKINADITRSFDEISANLDNLPDNVFEPENAVPIESDLFTQRLAVNTNPDEKNSDGHLLPGDTDVTSGDWNVFSDNDAESDLDADNKANEPSGELHKRLLDARKNRKEYPDQKDNENNPVDVDLDKFLFSDNDDDLDADNKANGLSGEHSGDDWGNILLGDAASEDDLDAASESLKQVSKERDARERLSQHTTYRDWLLQSNKQKKVRQKNATKGGIYNGGDIMPNYESSLMDYNHTDTIGGAVVGGAFILSQYVKCALMVICVLLVIWLIYILAKSKRNKPYYNKPYYNKPYYNFPTASKCPYKI